MNTQKAKTEKLFENGLPIGVQFTFTDGTVRRVTLDLFAAMVRLTAEVNDLTEALRDTYADEKTVAGAIAAFDKRLAVMVGPNGVYASRGGARIDWSALIWAAVDRLFPNLDTEHRARLEATLDGMDGASLKKWLDHKDRRALRDTVDTIRLENRKRGGSVDIGTLLG